MPAPSSLRNTTTLTCSDASVLLRLVGTDLTQDAHYAINEDGSTTTMMSLSSLCRRSRRGDWNRLVRARRHRQARRAETV